MRDDLKSERAKAPVIAETRESREDSDLQERFNQLEAEHSKLHVELEQQQKVTDQVRAEASAFLEEMRTLAEHDPTWASEKQIEQLKNEATVWKTRYAKSKAQIRSMRASGSSSSIAQPNIQATGSALISKHGIIHEASVAKFQSAMDDFVVKARSSTPKVLLEYLHGVVVATRVITQDVGSHPADEMVHLNVDIEELQSELAQATSLVSATANHLITTTRNHSSSGGLGPIFLLDAAASDLSGAVIELIKLAKVRPSSSSKEYRKHRGSSNGSIPANGNKSSHSKSPVVGRTSETAFAPHGLLTPESQKNRSLFSAQHETNSSIPDYNSSSRDRWVSVDEKFDASNPADNTVTALQEYLENQTVTVIDAIQELLTGIKDADSYSQLRRSITSITESVRSMLTATSGMMAQSKHWQLKEHGSFIVGNLENCCQRLQMLYGDSSVYDDKLIPDKHFKQRLAGISFDMAKCTTELVKTVEEVNLNLEIDQIDQKLQH